MTDATLSLCGFALRLPAQALIDPIDIAVAPGSVLGVFGDSGVGKSSLLHAIAGLLRPPFAVGGEVLLQGRSLSRCDASERSLLGVSIVLQDLGLFDDRSVAENLAYPLRRRGWPRPAIDKAVSGSLRRFAIQAEAERRPSQLSGGQRQRVALARALIYRPSLLLLDEPLRGLQDELRFELLAMLRSLCDDGTAMVLVTHDREEVALIADTVMHLRGGRVSIEHHRPGQSFGCLTPSSPAPTPDRALHPDELISLATPNAATGPDILTVLDVRRTPNGVMCALVRADDGTLAWMQIERGRDLAPGAYRVAGTAIVRLQLMEQST